MHIQVQKAISIYQMCYLYLFIYYLLSFILAFYLFFHILNFPLKGFEPATIKFHVRILNSLTPGHDRDLYLVCRLQSLI